MDQQATSIYLLNIKKKKYPQTRECFTDPKWKKRNQVLCLCAYCGGLNQQWDHFFGYVEKTIHHIEEWGLCLLSRPITYLTRVYNQKFKAQLLDFLTWRQQNRMSEIHLKDSDIKWKGQAKQPLKWPICVS